MLLIVGILTPLIVEFPLHLITVHQLIGNSLLVETLPLRGLSWKAILALS